MHGHCDKSVVGCLFDTSRTSKGIAANHQDPLLDGGLFLDSKPKGIG
jgi:hypothetical protein